MDQRQLRMALESSSDRSKAAPRTNSSSSTSTHMRSLSVVLPLVTCCVTAMAQTGAVDRAVSTARTGAPGFRGTVPNGELIRNLRTEEAPELYPGELQDVGPQFLVAREQQAAAERKL